MTDTSRGHSRLLESRGAARARLPRARSRPIKTWGLCVEESRVCVSLLLLLLLLLLLFCAQLGGAMVPRAPPALRRIAALCGRDARRRPWTQRRVRPVKRLWSLFAGERPRSRVIESSSSRTRTTRHVGWFVVVAAFESEFAWAGSASARVCPF